MENTEREPSKYVKKSTNSFVPVKYLSFGKHPVIEAIKENVEIEKVLVSNKISKDYEQELMEVSARHSFHIQKVPVEKLNRITNQNHQGVIAFLSKIKYYKISDVIMQQYDEGKSPFVLILDGITDVRNVGAIIRSAAAFGVTTIVVPQKGSAQINGETIKTSAGTIHHIKVCRVKTIESAIQQCKLSGLKIIGASLKGKSDLSELDLTEPLALVLGSEGDGIQNEVESQLDVSFKIPMVETVESLNVSVAASLVCYEWFKVNKI